MAFTISTWLNGLLKLLVFFPPAAWETIGWRLNGWPDIDVLAQFQGFGQNLRDYKGRKAVDILQLKKRAIWIDLPEPELLPARDFLPTTKVLTYSVDFSF